MHKTKQATMNQEVEEATFTKVNKAETDGNATSYLSNVDVLVCGVCCVGFHFVEEFEEHKACGSCKKVSLFQDQNTVEKPEVFGFLLWRNSQTKAIAVHEEIGKVNQMWCLLPESVKSSWIEAGKMIYSYEQLAKRIPKKVIRFCFNNPSSNDSLEEKPPTSVTTMKPRDDFPLFKEFVVERVVSHRFDPKKRQFEYLLKWEGYPHDQNTWEPAENLHVWGHLIKQYKDSLVKNYAVSSIPGKRPGRPRKIDEIQPKVSLQTVEQNEIGSVRSSKQKAINQVKFWCNTIKVKEETFKTKSIQQNLLKRDNVVLEDENIPIVKKKYFHQDLENKDWDDPTVHKPNASVSKNVKILSNYGKIVSKDQLKMEKRVVFNVPRRPSAFPILKREERVKQIKNYLSLFNNVQRNFDSGLIQISPYLTQVTLGAMKGLVKLDTYRIPQSGIYLFSATDGFSRLSDMDETKKKMLMMNKKHISKSKQGHIVYANGAKAVQPPKKTLDINSYEAREFVCQSSPLVQSYADNKILVPTTKTKTAVKPRSFLPKVDAANPEFKKSLPQILVHKHPGFSTTKSNQNNVTLVPQHTDSNIVQQGLHAYDSSEQLECLEDMEFSTDDNDLSDLFPIEDVQIPPSSPDKPFTLCHNTGKWLMKAELEKTPEPTPPPSSQSSMTIDYGFITNKHHQINKLEPGIENVKIPSPLVSNKEPEKINMNCTPHMESQIKQTHYKDFPASSNSGLCLNENSRSNNNINKSLHVSVNVPKSPNLLNVPAQRIQQKQQHTQVNHQFPGHKTILTDESRHLILSADNADSMITIAGDDGLLYQVSAAQLAASGGTVSLAGNGEGDEQPCVLTDDVNSMIQTNTNQERMIASDEISNFVNQVMPEEFDLENLVTDGAGNIYIIDNETGHCIPVPDTEQESQVALQLNKSHTQEPQVMHEQQPDQLIAQVVDAGEPAPGGGLRRVVFQLPDGSLIVTEMDEEQFAAIM